MGNKDLREKIKDFLGDRKYYDGEGSWIKGDEAVNHLLALLPDTEEAKRQIIEEVDSLLNVSSAGNRNLWLSAKAWEVLKERCKLGVEHQYKCAEIDTYPKVLAEDYGSGGNCG